MRGFAPTLRSLLCLQKSPSTHNKNAVATGSQPPTSEVGRGFYRFRFFSRSQKNAPQPPVAATNEVSATNEVTVTSEVAATNEIATNENISGQDQQENQHWFSEGTDGSRSIIKLVMQTAYKELKEEETTLVKSYEALFDTILKGVYKTTDPGASQEEFSKVKTAYTEERLVLCVQIVVETIIKKETEADKALFRRWVVSVFSQLSSLSKLDPVVAAYPPAATAWEIIKLILPTMVTPITNKKALAEGLGCIVKHVKEEGILAEALLERNWKEKSNFEECRRLMADRVKDLFKSLFKYQVKAVCRVYHTHHTVTALKDILGQGWITEDLMEIKEIQAQLQRDSAQYLIQFMAGDISYLGQREKAKQSEGEDILIGTFKTSPYEKRYRVVERREQGTCEWLPEHQKFRDWLKDDSKNRLFVAAGPGCGKTVLAKYVVGEVLPIGESSRTICYYFFSDTEKQVSGRDALCALLHQLFVSHPNLANICGEGIRRAGKLAKDFESLGKIWSDAASKLNTGVIHVVIDALNECETNDQEPFLDALCKSVSSKILITTQAYPSIERLLENHEFCNSIHLHGDDEATLIAADVEIVARRSVDKLQERKFSAEQKERIKTELLRDNAAQITYLWVCSVIKLIEHGVGIQKSTLSRILKSLPQDVAGVYDRLLANVHSTEVRKVRHLLELIIISKRPLSLQELNIALHILEIGCDGEEAQSEAQIDLVEDEKDLEEWIKTQCRDLVVVHGQIVDLFHPTVLNWLRKDDTSTVRSSLASEWQQSITIKDASRTMARSCIMYLALNDFNSYSNKEWLHQPDHQKLTDIKSKHKFLDYASTYWVSHFCEGKTQESEEYQELSLKVLDIMGYESGNFLPWYWINQSDIDDSFDTCDPGQTRLMAAISLDLKDIVSSVLQGGPEEMKKKSAQRGRTVLHWAALYNCQDILDRYLAERLDSTVRDDTGRTALHFAVVKGRKKMVTSLARYEDASALGIQDFFGLTPRRLAIRCAGYRSDSIYLAIADDLEAARAENGSAAEPDSLEDEETDLNQESVQAYKNRKKIKLDPDPLCLWAINRAAILRLIWSRKSVSTEEYMGLFTLMSDFCPDKNDSDSKRRNEIIARGVDFYNLLNRLVTDHVNKIMSAFQLAETCSQLDEAFSCKGLFLIREWSKYNENRRYISAWLRLLNKRVLIREIDEGKRDIYFINDLFLIRWNETFISPLKDLVLQAHANIDRGDWVDRALFHKLKTLSESMLSEQARLTGYDGLSQAV